MGSVGRLYILYDLVRWEEKALYEAAARKGLDVRMLDSKDILIDLNGGMLHESSVCDGSGTFLQRCVGYFRNLHLTAALEGKGYRVVNPFQCSVIAGNKLFAHIALVRNGIKAPRSMLAFTQDTVLKAIDTLGYPAVLKPTVGSWGRLIALIRDRDAAEAIVEDREHMFPLYQIYYLQEYVKRPPRDIRAIVAGERVLGAIYRYSGDGRWKTNMALGGRAEPCPVSSELEDVCVRACRAVNGEVVGVDLMEDEARGLLVHEVNPTTEFKNVARVANQRIADEIVEYVMQGGG
ncbi:MAG: lysine biosynthesis protein LysX [Candidatus Nitrosocaldus sp.]|nr:lysine biosynthesis protein LysX [Candidatus Nitrosocaldus sp.]MDW8000588.1 lysine biosynthesis protein LysX [Candidatus Nitrosocaldus sp.]